MFDYFLSLYTSFPSFFLSLFTFFSKAPFVSSYDHSFMFLLQFFTYLFLFSLYSFFQINVLILLSELTDQIRPIFLYARWSTFVQPPNPPDKNDEFNTNDGFCPKLALLRQCSPLLTQKEATHLSSECSQHVPSLTF
ncbi:hypothetical protein Csa_007344 [Cucumis sativus]|uniref:Uncharacterized protein n=1 Tax=Cucumis sativus TaxID=3659 RepID=A0A0A0LY70_CUCSA|nr:hypothetical protein Csa_007344 [Cucumis sativus]